VSGAEDTSLSPAHWGGAGHEAAPSGAPPRRRLFRKYALLFIALVGAALLINSAFDFWFSYQENKTALVRIQQEKAETAARRIEEFIGEIERQIGWTTHAQLASGSLDQRRQDYFRLQRQEPSITELTELDGQGKECLTVSRLKMDVVPDPPCTGADFSQNPAFTEARANRIWFSPVYFRKESEPYMTLAMAREGKKAGVTVAEINLKLIWDVITGLKIGQSGYAYVVDGRGRLIAHPDISLVLRDTDLSKLPQVAAALASAAGPTGDTSAATLAQNLAGRDVLTAHAAIARVGWQVFVEVPLAEAFAPLYGAAARTAGLLLFGLIAATLVALVIARRMTGPIRAIAAGAERIGAGELDRRIEIHTGDELEALAEQFNRMGADLQKSYAELEQRVADRTAELSESLDQQTATAEVLGVINSSPGDLTPVFDAMLEKAMELCGAAFGTLWICDGDLFHAVALRGVPEAYADFLARGPVRPTAGRSNAVLGGILGGSAAMHILDAAAEAAYQGDNLGARALIELGAARTVAGVPLRKDGALLGAITIYRQEVRPFSDKQIALLQNFAAQAVIAMENARLITETREALDQQTATAEVLGVINSSPGDLVPVFDAILEKAHSLCGIAQGSLELYDGENFRAVATRGLSDAFADMLRRGYPAADNPATRPLIEGSRFTNIPDVAATEYSITRSSAETEAVHTLLCVPLRRDDALLGMIASARREVRPFADKEIALLENFAAQAVIAMENARLITETREALEQQTATAEVLGVINSSPGDLAPVFDAMLDKALKLCSADYGVLWIRDGDVLRTAAIRGAAEDFTEFLLRERVPADADMLVARAVRERLVVHVRDAKDSEPYRRGVPLAVFSADRAGIRTILMVPLSRETEGLGLLTIYRQEVRPFSEKEIALVQNFAAQAVIAMENARLMTETREALDQQTATAEVLGVINASPGDLTPVFEAVLLKAHSLCGAAFGALMTYDGEQFQAVAVQGVPGPFREFIREGLRPAPMSPFGQIVRGAPFAHIHDLAEIAALVPDDPLPRAAVELGGIRSFLVVALRKEEALLGVIIAYRQEVRPFSDKQIALLQNFGAQAVIAMENARLIAETQEALDQQTATAEVLGVINSSPGDLTPVFDAMLDKATSLCGAAKGALAIYDGEYFRAVAERGLAKRFAERLRQGVPGRDNPVAEPLLAGERFVHIPDMAAVDHPIAQAAAQLNGTRTLLSVPLRKDESLLGMIVAYREEVRPFTDKQIALLQNFAAQAVIAMENARLLGELRSRTDELARSVEELKALGEVGQEVSATLDLRAVLVTILNRSVSLTGSDAGAIFRYSRAERAFHFVDAVGWDAATVGQVRDLSVGETVTALGDAIAHRAPLQIADLRTRPPNPLRDSSLAAGFRSTLIVPLVGADRIMGVTILQRRAVGEFPEAAVRLMQTLASQSVLAIQNARLFREIADKSEQLAQASEHKSQFLANMSHELRTPLNAILGYTELMVDGIYGELPPRAAGVLERVQNNGKHLLALINDVLDLAKIEAGQLTLTLEDFAMPDVVQSVVSATEGLANTKGLKFTADIMPGLPPGHGDARRLSQVLLNLVGNAVKFTDTGEVAIGAMAENGNFVLTVRDTGPGIAAADQDKIFGEFQQVDNSNTRKKGGTGLGLAISKRMVEMHGGTISVESEVGQGATFRVVLPIRVEGGADELTGELMGAA